MLKLIITFMLLVIGFSANAAPVVIVNKTLAEPVTKYRVKHLYLATKQVWWEKTVALLETQLRIRAEDNNQFIYLIVNRYTGPGVYHLRKGDVLASTRDGEAVELPEDIVAHVEVKFDEKGEIHGVFNIPKLASGDSQKEYVIYDGRFEARAEPPQEIEDQTGFLVKNQREI